MEVRAIDANALMGELSERIGIAREKTNKEVLFRFGGFIEDAPTLTLNALRDEIYQDAVAHGLFEDFDKIKDPVRKRRALAMRIMEEAAEMYAAADDPKKFAEEGADVTIMTGDVFGYLGMDWHGAVCSKAEVNKGRPWKHGKE